MNFLMYMYHIAQNVYIYTHDFSNIASCGTPRISINFVHGMNNYFGHLINVANPIPIFLRSFATNMYV